MKLSEIFDRRKTVLSKILKYTLVTLGDALFSGVILYLVKLALLLKKVFILIEKIIRGSV